MRLVRRFVLTTWVCNIHIRAKHTCISSKHNVAAACLSRIQFQTASPIASLYWSSVDRELSFMWAQLQKITLDNVILLIGATLHQHIGVALAHCHKIDRFNVGPMSGQWYNPTSIPKLCPYKPISHRLTISLIFIVFSQKNNQYILNFSHIFKTHSKLVISNFQLIYILSHPFNVLNLFSLLQFSSPFTTRWITNHY